MSLSTGHPGLAPMATRHYRTIKMRTVLYNRDSLSDKQGCSCVTRWPSRSVRRAPLMVGSRTTRQHPRGPDSDCVFWVIRSNSEPLVCYLFGKQPFLKSVTSLAVRKHIVMAVAAEHQIFIVLTLPCCYTVHRLSSLLSWGLIHTVL